MAGHILALARRNALFLREFVNQAGREWWLTLRKRNLTQWKWDLTQWNWRLTRWKWPLTRGKWRLTRWKWRLTRGEWRLTRWKRDLSRWKWWVNNFSGFRTRCLHFGSRHARHASAAKRLWQSRITCSAET